MNKLETNTIKIKENKMNLLEELNKIEAEIRKQNNTVLSSDMNIILTETIIKLQKLLYTKRK